jgi:hypothetical protein
MILASMLHQRRKTKGRTNKEEEQKEERTESRRPKGED